NKGGTIVSKSWGGNGNLLVEGDVTVGQGGDGVLNVRRVNGKHWLNDNKDDLFLNWNTGTNVHLGFGENTTSSLFVSGDTLIAGNTTVGAGGNTALKVRHINGKKPGTVGDPDGEDDLFLNSYNSKPVHIGQGGLISQSLRVFGDITYDGRLNKLDVGEGDGSAYIRANSLWFGSAGNGMGRALVNEIRDIAITTVHPTNPRLNVTVTKSMNTLVINKEPGFEAVLIGGTVQFPSSRQLKENIETLSSQAAKRIVSTLEPVRFTYKRDRLKLECLGFIAEDAPPEVASPHYDAIVMNHIVAALTRVVKDQERSIEALEAQVSLLNQQ
ncbi:MAG: tail fiber domain-containing protein, partial [Nitrospira sp.]